VFRRESEFLALCLGFALTPAFENALLADVLLFPAANPGDVFSDPATPLDPKYTQPGVQYIYDGAIGTMTTQLDGNTFSGGLDGIFVVPGTDSDWRMRRFMFALIRSPRRRGRAASAALRGQALWRLRD
jgi:hypothetical protein